MKSIIKINAKILDLLINHCHIDTNLECGGYLYGNYEKINKTNIININGIYGEKIFGKEDYFNFSPLYEARAKDFEKQINLPIIGCYHSHGKYPAIFSYEDRILETHYMKNNAALIYSPIENKLIGDIITTEKEVQAAKIIVVNQNQFNRLYFPNLSMGNSKVLTLKNIKK